MIQPIPAIDIIEGKCVRLSKGEYSSKKTYDVDPLQIAKEIEGYGFKRLHMVDLDGAKSNHIVNIKTLESVTTHTGLKVDFGGGIKSDDDIRAAFDNGAEWVTIGSMAVKEPATFERWLQTYGPERIILGADVKDNIIKINGWKEGSDMLLFPFLDHYRAQGIKQVLCTDIDRDGMLSGTSVQLYQSIMEKYPDCQLIASGGVSSLQDIIQLDRIGVPFVVFGKAMFEGKISLEEVASHFNIGKP